MTKPPEIVNGRLVIYFPREDVVETEKRFVELASREGCDGPEAWAKPLRVALDRAAAFALYFLDRQFMVRLPIPDVEQTSYGGVTLTYELKSHDYNTGLEHVSTLYFEFGTTRFCGYLEGWHLPGDIPSDESKFFEGTHFELDALHKKLHGVLQAHSLYFAARCIKVQPRVTHTNHLPIIAMDFVSALKKGE